MATAHTLQGMQDFNKYALAYMSLFQWKGKQEALLWLSRTLPPGLNMPFTTIGMENRLPSLLWESVGVPPADHLGDYIWLMRAGLGKILDPSAPDVGATLPFAEAHFKQQGAPAQGVDNHRLAEIVMDRRPASDVLVAQSEPKIKAIAYFLGLKAQLNGLLAEASDWYRVAVETGATQTGEYRWAYNTLYDWYARGNSLAILTEKLKPGERSGELPGLDDLDSETHDEDRFF